MSKVIIGKPGAGTPGPGISDDTEIEVPSIINTPVQTLNERRQTPVPGAGMLTVEENQALIDTDVTGVEIAQPTQDIPEGPPLPESEDEYGNVNNVTGQNIFLWDDNTPIDALPQATQELENQQTREDKSREQERIKSIPELFSDEERGLNITTLAGVRAALNNQPDNLMWGPLNRAARLAEGVTKTSMTQKGLEEWQRSQDPDKAFTAKQLGKDAAWSAKFPALKVANVDTDQATILYHPELLDAGLWDPNAREGLGSVELDPDFLETLSLVVEQFYVQGLSTRADEDIVTTTDLNDPEATQTKVASYTKAEGRLHLGKEIFKQWKRVQASKKGIPTDEYAFDFKNINDSVFEQLGDFAKEAYFLANGSHNSQQGLMTRGLDSTGQMRYTLTHEGHQLFTAMHNMYSAMFGAPEIAPLYNPTDAEAGQMVFEGMTYTRKATTAMSSELGYTDTLYEAMANMSKVVIRNNPGREKITFLMATAAITTAGNPKPVPNQYAQDTNEMQLTKWYSEDMPNAIVENEIGRDPLYEYVPLGDPAYADMFGIGNKKFKELLQEKKRLYNQAFLIEKKGRDKTWPAPSIGDGWSYYLAAKRYNPVDILNKEREKLLSILDAANRYSGSNNYLSYAMQALTGRIHSQQSLYNPQAHKVLRYLVGSDKVYTWTPGRVEKDPTGTDLDTIFQEVISAHFFEADAGTQEKKAFKEEFGLARTIKERLRVFREEERLAFTNPTESKFLKYVRWGEELEKIVLPFNARTTGNIFTQFRDASGDPRTRQEAIATLQNSFGADPISPDLKAYLSKHDEEAILKVDYLMHLAKYYRVKKYNRENKGQPPQQFKSTISIELDGQTHGPATLATLLGSESMAKRSGIIMKQEFQEMLNGEYKDLRDAMADAMRNEFDKISGGISWIQPSQTNKYWEILNLAIKDRANFLKKSPMTMGYGQEIKSLKQHVQTTVFQTKEIQDAVQDLGITNDQAVDFLHTMLVQSIYDTMDADTIAAAKLIKTVGYLSALTGALFQLPQPTGLLSTIAGRDSVAMTEEGKQLKTSYTLNFEDPDTKEVFGLTTSGQMNVQQYESVVSPAAMRKMFGKMVLGGYATGRLLPALIQAFDANMVASVFSNSRVGKIIGVDENGNPKYGSPIPTGFWDMISKRSKSLNRSKVKEHIPFVIPIFDAFMTDMGSYSAVREIANKAYQRSLVEEPMIEKVIDFYQKILAPKVQAIKVRDANGKKIMLDWSDPVSDYYMLWDLFQETELSRKGEGLVPTYGLQQVMKRLSWDEDMKWLEGKETLAEWDKRTNGLAKDKAKAIVDEFAVAAMNSGYSLEEAVELLQGEKVSASIVKKLLTIINNKLGTTKRIADAAVKIPEKRKAIAPAIMEGRVGNINIAN